MNKTSVFFITASIVLCVFIMAKCEETRYKSNLEIKEKSEHPLD